MILVLVNIAVGEKKLTDRCGLDLTSSGFCLCCWTEVDSASSVHCKCHDVGPPEHLGPVITHFTLTLHTHIHGSVSIWPRCVFPVSPRVYVSALAGVQTQSEKHLPEENKQVSLQ